MHTYTVNIHAYTHARTHARTHTHTHTHTKSLVGAARVVAGSRRESVAPANKENIAILTVHPYLKRHFKIVRGVLLNIIAIIVAAINTWMMTY